MNIEEKYESGCAALDDFNEAEAAAIFSEILSDDSDYYPAINKLGVLHARKGELDKAEECFNKSLEINPEFAPAIVNLGNIKKEKGDDKAAEELYKLAIEKDETYHMAYHNLAVVQKHRGDISAYIKNMKKYKKLNRVQLNERQKVNTQMLKRKLGCLPSIIVVLSCISIVLGFVI